MNAQNVQTCGINRSRALAHQFACILNLRECNYIPQAFCLQHNHCQTIQTNAQTTVRRCTVVVSFYQEAKLCFDFFIGQAQSLEHLLLQFIVCDTNRTRGQFCSIQNQVKCLCNDLFRIGVQIRQAFIHWHGERMVHRNPCFGFVIPFKERELCDPQEVELASRNQIQLLCNLQPQSTQNWQGYLVLVCNDQNHVTLFAAQCLQDGFQSAFRQELCKRAGRLCIVPADKCQTLCTNALCLFGQLVDFFSGQGFCCLFCDDCPNTAASFDGRMEYYKIQIRNQIGNILQFHAEPCIWLV